MPLIKYKAISCNGYASFQDSEGNLLFKLKEHYLYRLYINESGGLIAVQECAFKPYNLVDFYIHNPFSYNVTVIAYDKGQQIFQGITPSTSQIIPYQFFVPWCTDNSGIPSCPNESCLEITVDVPNVKTMSDIYYRATSCCGKSVFTSGSEEILTLNEGRTYNLIIDSLGTLIASEVCEPHHDTRNLTKFYIKNPYRHNLVISAIDQGLPVSEFDIQTNESEPSTLFFVPWCVGCCNGGPCSGNINFINIAVKPSQIVEELTISETKPVQPITITRLPQVIRTQNVTPQTSQTSLPIWAWVLIAIGIILLILILIFVLVGLFKSPPVQNAPTQNHESENLLI